MRIKQGAMIGVIAGVLMGYVWGGMMPVTVIAGATAQNTYSLTRPFELHGFQLKNGLRVLCQPRAASKSVVVMLSVDVGSRDETKENNGISHFVEHMVFNGTKQWNEREIKNIIAERGGKWNGFTNEEMTTYYAEIASENFETAMNWVSEIVFRSVFSPGKD